MRPEMRTSRERILLDPSRLCGFQSDLRLAPVWLVLRLVLGWLWVVTGWSALHLAPTIADPAATGLTLCGVALILGAFTGPVAFAGGTLCVGFWASAGPAPAAFLFAAVVSLMLAWKTAGWIGFDRWLLPLLGMTWGGGALLDERPDAGRGRR
jgi:hypothetical protein